MVCSSIFTLSAGVMTGWLSERVAHFYFITASSSNLSESWTNGASETAGMLTDFIFLRTDQMTKKLTHICRANKLTVDGYASHKTSPETIDSYLFR